MRALLAAVLFASGIAAQTYQLGTPTDPCTGGAPWSDPLLRYGTFTCSFPVSAPGFYSVTLNFQEPNVTAVGGRVFNVTVGQFPAIQKLDLVAAGASTSTVVISRTVPAISLDGRITIQLTTVVRNAVLSSVVISPVPFTGPKGDKGDKGDPGPPGMASLNQLYQEEELTNARWTQEQRQNFWRSLARLGYEFVRCGEDDSKPLIVGNPATGNSYTVRTYNRVAIAPGNPDKDTIKTKCESAAARPGPSDDAPSPFSAVEHNRYIDPWTGPHCFTPFKPEDYDAWPSCPVGTQDPDCAQPRCKWAGTGGSVSLDRKGV